MPEIVGRLRTPRLTGAPSSPAVGEVYYDTTTNILYWWNGTTWISASGGGAGGATDLRYNGNWAAGSYTDGDIVVYNGVSYMAVRPTSAAPTPWISPTGGADLRYDGAYTPANYTDGDIVIGADGVSYLCVKPTSAAPVPWASTQYPPKPTYGTTLPASPVDGQEAILVDSVTAPTYQWRFRYNASSTSVYKWEFIGGTPQINEDIAGGSGITSTTYVATGDQITVPRAGDYILAFTLFMANSVAAAFSYMAAKIGAAAADDNTGVFVQAAVAGGYGYASQQRRLNGLAASSLIAFWAHVSSGSMTYGRVYIFLTPIRIA